MWTALWVGASGLEGSKWLKHTNGAALEKRLIVNTLSAFTMAFMEIESALMVSTGALTHIIPENNPDLLQTTSKTTVSAGIPQEICQLDKWVGLG